MVACFLFSTSADNLLSNDALREKLGLANTASNDASAATIVDEGRFGFIPRFLSSKRHAPKMFLSMASYEQHALC